MAVDLHIAPDLRDPAIGSDQYRTANDSEKRPAIHGFLAPGAIGLQHLMPFIRNQRNRKPCLSRNFSCARSESAEMPRTAVPLASKAAARRVKSIASRV